MSNYVDLFLFVGQSNMAGRSGELSLCKPVSIEKGLEFRAISDPTRLYNIKEPFGLNENKTNFIDDKNKKCGGLVSEFINQYYDLTQHRVVALSASKGGPSIKSWVDYLFSDAETRFKEAVSFLSSHGYHIRNRFALFCQGESDGDLNTTQDEYISYFSNLYERMKKLEIQKCFMIEIGECNIPGEYDRYDSIIEAQNRSEDIFEDVLIVSRAFKTMRKRKLMKDEFHYKQEAYNEVGRECAINIAHYVNQIDNLSLFN